MPHKKLFACTYTMGVNDRTMKGNIYTKDAFYSFNKGITERMPKFHHILYILKGIFGILR